MDTSVLSQVDNLILILIYTNFFPGGYYNFIIYFLQFISQVDITILLFTFTVYIPGGYYNFILLCTCTSFIPSLYMYYLDLVFLINVSYFSTSNFFWMNISYSTSFEFIPSNQMLFQHPSFCLSSRMKLLALLNMFPLVYSLLLHLLSLT